MRPGEVKSDEQAFRQILSRLEDDVGTILQLISKSKEVGVFPNTAPFWGAHAHDVSDCRSGGRLDPSR